MKGYFHIHRLKTSIHQIPRSVGRYLASIGMWALLAITAHAQLSGYSHVQEIYIDHSMVSGSSNLSNFPLLIQLTEDYLRSTGNGGDVTNANGFDIALSVDGTTALDHEIESYNATTGEFIAWVNIPTLYHDRYTILYLSYGNGSVGTDPSSTGTWNSDYVGIWHLDENVTDEANGGTHQDATTNNYDGTQYGNAETTGVFDDGQDFDGTDDHINAGAAPGSQTSITVSFWMKTDVDNAYQRAIGKMDVDAADDQGWSFMLRPAGEVGFDRGMIFRIGDATDYGGWTNEVSAENVYTAGTWVYVVGTFAYNGSNGGTGTLYANGVNVASKSNTDGRGIDNTSNALYIGWDYWGDFYDTESFDGALDEVRIAGVARSADWIATEYNNQSDPTVFLSVGAPTGPGGVGSANGKSNLVLWLDANNITASNGADVTLWPDQSGYGNNAVGNPLSDGSNPEYNTNGVNGQPHVEFIAANSDYVGVPNDASLNPNTLSIFVAGNLTNNSDNYGGYVLKNGGAWDDGYGFARGDLGSGNDAQLLAFVDDYTSGTVGTPIAYGEYGVNTMIYDKTQIEVYYNENTPGTTPQTADIVDAPDHVYIGWTTSYLDGDIAEVIMLNRAVNDVERIIISNYLSAKYDITLADNDVYKADQAVEGDFDHDVAGIGSLNGDVQNDAQGSGILRVMNPQDLDNDEFFMWGSSNGSLEATIYTDLPSGVEARFEGLWRANERNSAESVVDVGTLDLIFNLDGLGEINASDLRLIVDTDQDSLFADQTTISGATHLSGSLYLFAGVSDIDDNDLFTIGTADAASTPLRTFSAEGSQGPGGVGEIDGSSDLIVWLDANTISLADGSDVATWPDESGYANDGIGNSLSDGSEPVFYQSGLNGYPEITFTAANDDYIYVEPDATLNTITVSSFVVGNMTNSSESYAGFMIKDGGGWDDGWGIVRNASAEELLGWVSDYTSNFVTETAFSYGVPAIHSLHYDKSQIEFYTNESTPLTFAHTADIAQNANGIFIGWTSAYMDGDISEAIVFNNPVTEAERIIIHNYLAAKYGRTLGNNDVYTMDDVANGDYDHDVAGIGQASDGSNNTEARGTGILRVILPTDLGNNEFLMWGHDNGALTVTDSTDIPTGMTARLERVWRTSEVGDVGSVDMIWDLSAPGLTDAHLLRLLVDTDNDGAFDDETPIRDASLVGTNTFRFGGVDALDNNLRFTLGVAVEGPGGVADDLVLWLRADDGVQVGGMTAGDGDEPDTWLDQSSQGNDATKAGASEYATYIAERHNYNPAIYFSNGDNGYFDVDLTSLDGTDYNLIAIVERDNSVADNYIVGITGTPATDNERLHFGYRTNTLATLAQFGNDVNVTVDAFDSPEASVALLRGQLDQTSGKTIYELRDGTAVSNSDGSTTPLTITGTGRIGRSYNTQGFEGYVSEVIAYSRTLTDAELERIYSYLSMKYDFELESTKDIIASDGSILWDISAEPAYNNDVIVLGRDNQSLFHQKQSRTDDDSLRVYVGSLAANNPQNTSSISNDLSYLVIGHNGGALSALWNETEMPGTVTSRFEREWKVTNVNFRDSYTLEFEWEELGPFDINDIRLLVDSDGDFSDATIYGPADGLTFSVGSIIVEGVGTSQIPANSTMYVTVASVGTTPLPIELIHFEAVANQTDHTVDLTWSTATETDNDFFTIEKSQDAQAWSNALMIPGAGNSSGRIDYEAIDEDPYYGLSYYRLKQTDFDGTFSYSDIVFVTLGEFEEELTIYPNPTQRLLTIKGSPEQLRQIAMIDASGRDVTGSVRMISHNETTVTLDVSGLPVGIFSILAGDRSIKMVKSP